MRAHRAMARQASRSGLSTQPNSLHPRRIRPGPYASISRATQHRRGAVGLIAGIIGLGLIGLCLRTLPTVLMETNLVAGITGPLPGIPAGPATTAAPAPLMSIEPTTEARPTVGAAKLQAKRKVKSLQTVEVPASGPGTYRAAGKSLRPSTSAGALIRYDVRVEKGLSIDPEKAAVLIQGILDDQRSWRGTGRWRFELTPVGQSATLHAYIVTPETTDRLCAPYLTRGEVSCQSGDRVVMNAKRWLLGADSYGSDLTNYRRYLVNHEFGHALGKHHVDCPAPGRLVPIMLQQTKGLQGCRKNPWP
jgi:hypothetical protein